MILNNLSKVKSYSYEMADKYNYYNIPDKL